MTLPGFLHTPFAGLPAGFEVVLRGISTDTLLVVGAYIAIGGFYLVVAPLALLAWMSKRWTAMGKIERTTVYGLVFLFFPGLILFAPFVNLRMAGQGPDTP